MADLSEVFNEIQKSLKSLSKRINKFETWEPTTETHIACHAYHTSGQALTFGAWTTLKYDTVYYDPYDMYSTTTGEFTAPVDGRYLFNTFCPFTNFYAGIIYARYNCSLGANYVAQMSRYAQYTSPLMMTANYLLSAGDSVTFDVLYNNAPGGNAPGAANYYYYDFTQVELQAAT